MTVKKSWKLAYELLGKVNNKSPTKIKHGNEIISNPKALAEAFSHNFKGKVRKLCEKTKTEPKVDPVERLDSWLSEKTEPIPDFELKSIDRKKLRLIMKRMKPSCSHGMDFIDYYSLKLAFPLIEDSILHLVNLSITSGKYSLRTGNSSLFFLFTRRTIPCMETVFVLFLISLKLEKS